MPPFERSIRKLFSLPDHVLPLSLVMVGYPAEFPEARTQFEESALHWDHYSNQT
jgi:nitroreductase